MPAGALPLSDEPLLAQLRAVVGAQYVLGPASAEPDLAPFERDWRGRARGRARAVVLPASTEQAAQVVRLCAQAGVAIVPQGGNTGLVLGSVPDASGTELLLSTRRLNRIRALDAVNLTLTAEAGCVLQSAQQAAQAAGLWLPLSLASEGSCTLGGNLASNAGGTQVLRFGNARELCLGLEVVLPDGQIWHGLSGLRKDNSGYDLRQLFIGSEGTLGLITAATLKLQPQPAALACAWVGVPSLKAALQLLALAQRQLGPSLTGFEFMSQAALALVAQHLPPLRVPLWRDWPACVLLELSLSAAPDQAEAQAQEALQTLLAHALEQGCAGAALVAATLAQAQQLWQVREGIPQAQAAAGLNVKHDISLPLSRLAAFCTETEATLQGHFPGVRLINFGHLGDGNLHYNVQCPPQADASAFLHTHEAAINALVFDAVQRHGGSISAEHGVGRLRSAALRQYKDPLALALMQRIKQALDPHGLFNPGRVLERAAPANADNSPP